MFEIILRLMSLLTLAVVIVASPCAFAQERPGEFRVRNAATAIKIAKVAFEQEFGKEELGELRCFEASLKGDHWEVTGTHHKCRETSHGGAFEFVIAVKGGCVLQIIAEM